MQLLETSPKAVTVSLLYSGKLHSRPLVIYEEMITLMILANLSEKFRIENCPEMFLGTNEPTTNIS